MTKLDTNLTMDPAYEAVVPTDFHAMMEDDRYNKRSTVFDKIISATNDHFWDPTDTKYIDFSVPFDLENEYLNDPKQCMELRTSIASKLTEKQKIKLANLDAKWSLSSILHGEAAALALSASLCHILKDAGAQEYAANQTREEARHVAGFTHYMRARFGGPYPVGEKLGDFLADLVNTPIVWKKIIGMQMIAEGLAMGAFATFYKYSRDPVLTKLMQLTMTDEAFHHKFGKIWADKTVPNLPKEDRDRMEDWAWEAFQIFLFNLAGADQKRQVYLDAGLNPDEIEAAYMESMTDVQLRQDMQESTYVMRVLIKTLVKSGIITSRTAPNYAAFVDMQELYAEGDRMAGDSIAEEGIKYLRKINGMKGDNYSLETMNAAD
jgi:hypothetical protein